MRLTTVQRYCKWGNEREGKGEEQKKGRKKGETPLKQISGYGLVCSIVHTHSLIVRTLPHTCR